MPYQNHPHFTQFSTPSKVILWRYMRLEALVKILKNKTLKFNKISLWRDLREGHVEPFTQETLANALSVTTCPQYIVDGINDERQKAKHKCFASCWCSDNEEINLMWDTYGSSDREDIGVAIKTTAQILYSAIIDERKVYSGVINYEKFPFTPKAYNVYIDCLVKDRRYKSEKELRLFYLGEDADMKNDCKEKYIDIDTSKVLSDIYINPYATTEDYHYVENQIRTADKSLQFQLHKSDLLCKPREYDLKVT